MHELDDLSQDNEGWWWVACHCCWSAGPFPGRDDAIEEYADHRAAVAS